MDVSKIFKRIIFTSLFLILNATAFTDDNYPLFNTGLYLGLGTQYNYGSVTYDSNSSFILGLLGTETEHADINVDGHSTVGLIGFGIPLPHQFYIGIEGQGVNANQEGNLSIDSFFHEGIQVISFAARVKYLSNYGLFLRPGYFITPDFLLFLRGGCLRGKFETAAVPGELGSIVPALNDVKQTEREHGYLVGGGIDVHLFRGLGARAEYDYSRFSSFNNSTAFTFQIPAAEFVRVTTANRFSSPTNSTVTLALTYSFGYPQLDLHNA